MPSSSPESSSGSRENPPPSPAYELHPPVLAPRQPHSAESLAPTYRSSSPSRHASRNQRDPSQTRLNDDEVVSKDDAHDDPRQRNLPAVLAVAEEAMLRKQDTSLSRPDEGAVFSEETASGPAKVEDIGSGQLEELQDEEEREEEERHERKRSAKKGVLFLDSKDVGVHYHDASTKECEGEDKRPGMPPRAESESSFGDGESSFQGDDDESVHIFLLIAGFSDH